jgi:Zn-dependent M28 family amino/carboxypeptidase
MPDTSYTGNLPEPGEVQTAAAKRMRKTVHRLSEEIGPRNASHPEAAEKARKFIERRLSRHGHAVELEEVETDGQVLHNVVAEHAGTSRAHEIVVIGAHYDTAGANPGANDNASGVAALLELSERLSKRSFPRTIRFVAFTNEEPPQFQTEKMGSLVNARAARERGDHIAGMISLETLGYYDDAAGSQQYPPGVGALYPDRGDFVAFVGNVGSMDFVRRCVGTFRAHARFPSEGIAAPDAIPGIGWSDHWSFYGEGYPALMVTDTAPFRYPHYHLDSDRIEHLDFDRMALVVDGLEAVVSELAGEPL